MDQAGQAVLDAIDTVTDDKTRADLLSRWDRVMAEAVNGNPADQIDKFTERLAKLTGNGTLGQAQSALIRGAAAAFGVLFG